MIVPFQMRFLARHDELALIKDVCDDVRGLVCVLLFMWACERVCTVLCTHRLTYSYVFLPMQVLLGGDLTLNHNANDGDATSFLGIDRGQLLREVVLPVRTPVRPWLSQQQPQQYRQQHCMTTKTSTAPLMLGTDI